MRYVQATYSIHWLLLVLQSLLGNRKASYLRMIQTLSTGHIRKCTAAVSTDLCAPLEPTNGDSIATLLLRVAFHSLLQYTADPIPVLSGSRYGELCDVLLNSNTSHNIVCSACESSVTCLEDSWSKMIIHNHIYEQAGSELSTELVSTVRSSLTFPVS